MSKYAIYKNYPQFLADFCKRYKNRSADLKAMSKLKGYPLVDRFLASPLHAGHSLPLVFKILYGEMARASLGNVAIFLRDEDITRLTKGKYQLDSIPADFFPYDAFTVCFPASFTLNGKKLPGVQVSFTNNKENFIDTAQKLLRALPNNRFFGKGESVDVAYHDMDLTLSYIAQGNEEHSFLTYRGDALLQIINSDNSATFKQNARQLAKSLDEDCALSDDEMEMQYVILRTILGMCVYLKANPDALKEGFPPVKNFSLAEPFGVPTRALNFDAGQSLSTGTSPRGHYRSWHIRQLSHPRYYQNEHKDKAPGSRFVFVSDTMVNSTMTPQHVD